MYLTNAELDEKLSLRDRSGIGISPEMIDAGIGCIADYEMGATSAAEFVSEVFCSMLSAYLSGLVPAPTGRPLEKRPA